MKDRISLRLLVFAYFVFPVVLLLPVGSYSQVNWVLRGGAVSLGGGCVELTDSITIERSAIWNPTQINVNNGFDYTFFVSQTSRTLLTGNAADGLAFVLQRTGTNALSVSSGNTVGYASTPVGAVVSCPHAGGYAGGINPSLAVELDIFDNSGPTVCINEIPQDHIAIHVNGDPENPIAGPVTAFPGGGNIVAPHQSYACREFRIRYNGGTQLLEVFYNGVMRLSTTINIAGTVFGGNSNVYFGITGSTGGLRSHQIVCFDFASAGPDATVCLGNSLQLQGGGGVTYNWTPAIMLQNPNTVNPTFTAPFASSFPFEVRVTNFAGCTDRDTVLVTAATPPTAVPGVNRLICLGDSAQIGTPAQPNITYSWAPAAGLSNPALANPMASPAATTTYTLTVTQNFGGVPCTGTGQVTVTVNPRPVANAGPNVIVCPGTCAPLGIPSTPGWTYTWSPPAGLNNANISNPQSCPGLTTTYTLTVADLAAGCSRADTVTVTRATTPTLATTSVTDVNCNGGNDGAATVAGSGGSPGYTYSWSNGQSGPTATSLSAGTVQVTVTDLNGCRDTLPVTINQPPVLAAQIGNFQNISCFGTGDGSATGTAGGGSPGYTYTWSNNQSGPNATGLVPGTYILSVTDNHGCVDTARITISQPQVLQATIASSFQPLCPNTATGRATASGSGGTPGYTYVWATVPPQNTALATGLAAGTYRVTVSDQNGCLDSTTVTLTDPSGMTLTTGGSSSTCGNADGRAWVGATGGTPGYTYLWSGTGQTGDTAVGLTAGTWWVYVRDVNGCLDSASVSISNQNGPQAALDTVMPVSCFGGADGSATVSATGGVPGYSFIWSVIPVQTGPSATGLRAGIWWVVVSDADDSIDSIPVTVSEPAALVTALDSALMVACNGESSGSAFSSTLGGTAPYTWYWNSTPPQATADAYSLQAGVFDLIVTDDNGCRDSLSVTITEPSPISVQITVVGEECGLNNGSATGTPSGGTPGYQFVWNTVPVQNSPTATGLAAGPYRLIVTDSQGCSDTSQVTVNSLTPVPVAAFNSNPPPGAIDLVNATISFSNQSSNANSYFWYFGTGDSSNVSNPVYTFSQPGTWCVTLVAQANPACWDSTQQCYEVSANALEFPNTFTPNSDEVNDLFEIIGVERYPNGKLSIYSRWGNLIYEAQPYQNTWDGRHYLSGKKLPDGVYFYIFAPGVTGVEATAGSVVILR